MTERPDVSFRIHGTENRASLPETEKNKLNDFSEKTRLAINLDKP